MTLLTIGAPCSRKKNEQTKLETCEGDGGWDDVAAILVDVAAEDMF